MKRFKNIIVFDFETTGLKPGVDKILEIGAIKYELINGKFVEVSTINDILLTDGIELPAFITELTGITKETQEMEGISQKEGYEKMNAMFDKDSLLIAYNIQFDYGFLVDLFKTHDNSYKFENPIMDVMAIYKDRHKYPHKLDSAVAMYNVTIPNTHRAIDDVRATYEVFKELAKENYNFSNYINVIGFNPKYPVLESKKIPNVRYVPQYGGQKEIEKL